MRNQRRKCPLFIDIDGDCAMQQLAGIDLAGRRKDDPEISLWRGQSNQIFVPRIQFRSQVERTAIETDADQSRSDFECSCSCVARSAFAGSKSMNEKWTLILKAAAKSRDNLSLESSS
jgi:hypothetical protein